jgi:GNAT superfamily N-acetyltransferase
MEGAVARLGIPMTADIAIAEVTSETIGLAVLLLEHFFSQEGFDTPPARIAANVAAMVDDQFCWVGLAAVDGAFAGVVTVTTMLYVEWGRLGEIGDLYVLPAYRGRGVARSLSSAAQDWCRAHGCSAISVVVTPDGSARHNLVKVYGALGFDRTGREILVKPI